MGALAAYDLLDAGGGDVLVADSDGNRIVMLYADGSDPTVFALPGQQKGRVNYPVSLAYGPNAGLFVRELGGGGRVQRFV
jgi:hypothetical protein